MSSSDFFNGIKEAYKEWKGEHDEDYCYDEIMDFVSTLDRGDLFAIFEHLAE